MTRAYSTYTLCAGQTFPPPCPTAQLTIAYQTADEESAPQLLSAISRFCTLADLGAHKYGFLCAHVCVSGVRMCAYVGIRVHVQMPECVHGSVSTYVLACMCVCVPACVSA